MPRSSFPVRNAEDRRKNVIFAKRFPCKSGDRFAFVMRILKYAFVLLLGCLAASCGNRSSGSRYVTPYVVQMLADTTSYDYQVVSSYDATDRNGTLTIIGEPEETLLLTEMMMTSDRFNNISATLRPDGLPDFSGETFAPILDRANAPYEGYIAHGNEDFLSELTVRNFVAALDTACFLSSYDKDRLMHKAPAKMIILSSSLSAAYGYWDIDTLCTLSSRAIPVFSAPQAMLDHAWDRHGEGLNLGVWTTRKTLGAGVWSTVFPRIASRHHDAKATYEVFCPDSTVTVHDRFFEFMHKYAAAGNSAKLSALLLDDYSIDADSLRAVVDAVMQVDQDNYITYRNFLADDFEIIDAGSAVSSVCYLYLRKANRFTHRIAYPDVKMYVTAPSNELPETAYSPDGWMNAEFRYNRAVGVAESSYSLVELKDKHLTTELRDLMIVSTPKIFSNYVR